MDTKRYINQMKTFREKGFETAGDLPSYAFYRRKELMQRVARINDNSKEFKSEFEKFCKYVEEFAEHYKLTEREDSSK